MKLSPATHVSLALHHLEAGVIGQALLEIESELNSPSETLVPLEPLESYRAGLRAALEILESRKTVCEATAMKLMGILSKEAA